MNKSGNDRKKLIPDQRETLLETLRARFSKNMGRHKGINWEKVQARLEGDNEKLHVLYEMERTGGEPDVVMPLGGLDKKNEWILFLRLLTGKSQRTQKRLLRPAGSEREERKQTGR